MNVKKNYEIPVSSVIALAIADAVMTSNSGGIELPDHEW